MLRAALEVLSISRYGSQTSKGYTPIRIGERYSSPEIPIDDLPHGINLEKAGFSIERSSRRGCYAIPNASIEVFTRDDGYIVLSQPAGSNRSSGGLYWIQQEALDHVAENGLLLSEQPKNDGTIEQTWLLVSTDRRTSKRALGRGIPLPDFLPGGSW